MSGVPRSDRRQESDMRRIAGALVIRSASRAEAWCSMRAQQQDPAATAQAVTTAAALSPAPRGAAASRRRAVPQAGDDRGRIRFRERLHVPRHLGKTGGAIVPPFVDVGVLAYHGTGALKSVTVNGGFWNSLHSGPSGNSGKGSPWYEARLLRAVTFAVRGTGSQELYSPRTPARTTLSIRSRSWRRSSLTTTAQVRSRCPPRPSSPSS